LQDQEILAAAAEGSSIELTLCLPDVVIVANFQLFGLQYVGGNIVATTGGGWIKSI
jgi:hypothetical protein